jgi:hypothetical protein
VKEMSMGLPRTREMNVNKRRTCSDLKWVMEWCSDVDVDVDVDRLQSSSQFLLKPYPAMERVKI